MGVKYRKILTLIAIAMALPSCKLFNKNKLNQLTTPKVRKIVKENYFDMSQKTYDSYMAFARKFTSYMMEVNNSEKEESLGISIPDAYLCLAICGAISTDDARNDVLSYLELNDMDELRTSVKEMIKTLATLMENSEGKNVGGYNLNSVWFNPEKVELIKEKDEQLYKDLEEVFDASLFMEALTSKKANQYIKDNGLKDMPAPEIKLDDEDPAAINVMSVYYCLDYFKSEAKEAYKKEYKSGKHKMDYYLNNNKSSVDYIQSSNFTQVFENDNFCGSSLAIGSLNMSFFLPNQKTALPSTIMKDVLDENYSIKQSSYINFDNQEVSTTTHNVNIQAPYFSLDNKSELTRSDLYKILPAITEKGAGERIAKAYEGPMHLDYIKQFSVMKFNYDGFYSCSATIAGMKAESALFNPEYEKFDLILDHPYIFNVNKSIRVGDKFLKVPLVIGEIVTPEYKE